MTKSQDIRNLQALSQIVLDARLADLRAAARARDQTLAHLRDLTTAQPWIEGASGMAEAQASLAYQRWADARRADLNQTLAQQTALWIEGRDAARQAFGKSDVLAALARKPRR